MSIEHILELSQPFAERAVLGWGGEKWEGRALDSGHCCPEGARAMFFFWACLDLNSLSQMLPAGQSGPGGNLMSISQTWVNTPVCRKGSP